MMLITILIVVVVVDAAAIITMVMIVTTAVNVWDKFFFVAFTKLLNDIPAKVYIYI